MDRLQPPRAGAPERTLARRDFLKLVAFTGGAATAGSLIAGCAPRGDATSPGVTSRSASSAGASASIGASGRSALSGPITMIAGGDPATMPPLRKVLDEFHALHPGTEWDIRPLTGGGPEWDRLARGLLASGESVDLTMINGQQVGGWVRDGLLVDLTTDPNMTPVLARIPEQFRFGGGSGGGTHAFPLAMSAGLQTTGLYVNKALLDEVGVEVPRTIADLEAMVVPLARLGVAPLVHCSGDVFFNQILMTWILPMIVERAGADASDFVERTVKGEVRYDSPEWVAAFETIAKLRSSGVLLKGSGATDYAAMQQLLLQGKAATTFQGTWMLPEIEKGTPSGPWDLRVAPPPLVEGAPRPRPILAWTGFGLPSAPSHNREAAYAFLEYASRPEVDREITKGSQQYSPLAASNEEITDPVAREFLPLFDDAIQSLDWLWEPEITAEIDNQVQALVKGATQGAAAARAVQNVAEDLRAAGRSYYP
jgi:ABC-type glycerol-3-phosphate transport system substrate-binding protein